MTSNLGARHLQKRTSIGFRRESMRPALKSMEDLVLGEVKRAFNPEFLNRLDEVILFNPLGDDDLLRIIDLLVRSAERHAGFTGRCRWSCRRKHASGSWRNVCGPQLWCAAAAAGFAEVCGRSALRGSDPRGIQRPATLQIYVAGESLAFRPVVEATPAVH